MHGDRVWVVGTTGSGKTRLAAALARRLGVPHIELDALFHGPAWAETPEDEFVRCAVEALDVTHGWVVDGNYRAMHDELLSRVTDVVWLDYRRPVVLWRVVRRSLARAVLRRELWNGNRETLRAWLDPEHPVRWAWTSHATRRAEYGALAGGDPRWHHVRSRRSAAAIVSCSGASPAR